MPIELTPAKCPCCGAELMLNENMESGYCQYCGSKILVKAAVAFQKVIVEGTVKTKASDFTIKAGVLERYNGEDIDVVIPSNVVIIGEEAFKDCKALRSVKIPEGVTEIEKYAFAYCPNLISVEIPNSVTTIGHYSFYGCRSLKAITIPENVTEIGNRAFRDCDNLTDVYLFGKSSTAFFDHSQKMDVEDSNRTFTHLERLIINGVEYCGEYRFLPWGSPIRHKLETQEEEAQRRIDEEKRRKAEEQRRIEEEKRRQEQIASWKSAGLCQHCGGKFRFGKCKDCGRKKDY